MKYRRLGRSGLQVSELALGTMNFGGPTNETDSLRIIDRALDHGINLFDCADVYAGGASETIIGKALRGDGKRKNAFITTKAFLPTGDDPNDRGNSRHHLINACEKSLGPDSAGGCGAERRIVEPYQIHPPPGGRREVGPQV